MSQPNPSTALGTVMIDELVRCGATYFVISPGSRSAALAIAAVEHPDAESVVFLDERSAAFHALGHAKASGRPAAVISTSGTGPANFLPAIVEADMSLTPLLLLTADRPDELRGVGANQTIDQVHLYGDHVRVFHDIAAPEVTTDGNATWRSLASEAVSASVGVGSRPGPVHLNVAFREPTVPVSDDGRSTSLDYPFEIDGAGDGAPWRPRKAMAWATEAPPVEFRTRGMVIAGEGAYQRQDLLTAATELGWPVLATALSEMRGDPVIDCYHHILAEGVPSGLRPEIAVAVGAVGPSSRLNGLISAASIRIRVDPWGRHIDPDRNATHIIKGDPLAVLAAFSRHIPVDHVWRDSWVAANAGVRNALAQVLDSQSAVTGAGVVWTLNRSDWSTLVVGSSLPIREVDAHLTKVGRVVANRGASGIDGFNSTALGVASVDPKTVAVTGDLGFLHDSNAFLNDGSYDLVLVVVDNDGGGLFDGLPQARHAPAYERLFVAPQGRDLSRMAALHDLRYEAVDDLGRLAAGVDELLDEGGVSLVHVKVDRAVDLEARRALDDAAMGAVDLLDG